MSAESTKLQIWSARALYLLCMLFFLITFLNCISTFSNNFGLEPKYFMFFIFVVIGVIIIAFMAERLLSKLAFVILLCFIAFVVRLVWVFNVQTPVISDFSLMYHSAISAAKGDFRFSQTDYFQNWVYQLGFTMYEAIIIKLFGQGLFVLKLLNILYSVGTTFLIYKIASKLFNETAGRIAGLFYANYIPNIIMSSVLTNEHLSTFLFYLGFFLLISDKSNKWIVWVVFGTLLCLGNIIRPLGSFIIVVLAIFIFLTQFLKGGKTQIILAVKKLVSIIIVFYVIHMVLSQVLISFGVTQYPLSNRDPLWKFVLGFNQETTGQYSQKDLDYVRKYPIGTERNTVEEKLIKQRTADKGKVLVLFKNKLKIMWADNDASVFWSLGHIHNTPLKDRINKIERITYISVILFCIIAMISLMTKSTINHESLLIVLLILGYVAIHLLIEIQTRYRYFIIPSFFIIQGFGVCILMDTVTTRIGKIKFKKGATEKP